MLHIAPSLGSHPIVGLVQFPVSSGPHVDVEDICANKILDVRFLGTLNR